MYQTHDTVVVVVVNLPHCDLFFSDHIPTVLTLSTKVERVEMSCEDEVLNRPHVGDQPVERGTGLTNELLNISPRRCLSHCLLFRLPSLGFSPFFPFIFHLFSCCFMLCLGYWASSIPFLVPLVFPLILFDVFAEPLCGLCLHCLHDQWPHIGWYGQNPLS